MFRNLLVLPDGSPTEPAAVLVTAVPNWKVGEVCMTGSGDQFRILAIDMEVHEELAEQGINGMFRRRARGLGLGGYCRGR